MARPVSGTCWASLVGFGVLLRGGDETREEKTRRDDPGSLGSLVMLLLISWAWVLKRGLRVK